MMLAAFPSPTPNELASWLVSAGAVVWLATQLRLWVRKPPLEAEFVSRKEFIDFKQKLEKDFDSIWGKLDRSFETMSEKLAEQTAAINLAGERRIGGVYDVVNEVRDLVNRVDERTKHLLPHHRR